MHASFLNLDAVLVHEVDLHGEKGEGNPTAREERNDKAAEESPDTMGGRSCQDKDGGDGVEAEVEDHHSHLEPPAPSQPFLALRL